MDKIKLFSGGFPLTIERLEFLQNCYTKAMSQFSKVAGSGNLILDGVVLDTDPDTSVVSDGVIVIDGEVMEFRGGDYNNTVSIYEETVNVPYNEDADSDGDLDLKAADTVRFASCGTGGVQSILYSSLVRVSSLLELMPKVGDVKMILRDYDPLVDIGWEVLDMGDRFPMGASATVPVGQDGGENSVSLTENQMPAHNHSGTTSIAGNHAHAISVRNGVMTQDQNIAAGGEGNDDTKRITSATSPNGVTTFAGGHSHIFNTNSKGGGQAHENRPAFRAFTFLVFVGF